MEGLVRPSPEFWRGKRVLLTGHTGFKGVWCALWLQKLGATVYGLALRPEAPQSFWSLVGSPCQDQLGDIREPRAVANAFEAARPDLVIHMAAQALVHASYVDPVGTFETNVLGLIHVLHAAKDCPSVRAVVNVTSDKCYENREQLWAYREDEAMGGSDPYSASKGCAELVTTSYRRSFFKDASGSQLASGRAGNVIGGGDWAEDRLVPDCVRSFSAGAPALIRNPLATRPWQHVLEPVSGYLTLAQALYEQGADFAEGWNFGPSDQDAWSVGRVADRLVHLWGEGAAWRQDANLWPKEAMLLRVDATKARVRLGWRPRLGAEEALDWTVAWYKSVQAGHSALEITTDQIERYARLVSA